MSLEDPFFVVKDEVTKTLQNCQTLYQRWQELANGDRASYTKEELEWTSTELKNSLRSIEWDLEDLEETISIVEKNPKKFKIDEQELVDRRAFINRTKNTVKEIRTKLSNPPKPESKKTSLPNGPSKPMDKYTRLENEVGRANQKFIDDTHSQQQMMMSTQDEQLDVLGSSVTNLKGMSQQIGSELDEQAVMLDDFAHEMENTDTKMDNVMKKMAKVLHMSNDRRQWCAIGILLAIMILVIILFCVL